MRRLSTTLLWLVLVFASGLTMGVVGHRYFAKETAAQDAPERPTRDQLRHDYLSKLRSRVGADEAQIQKVVEILDRGRTTADAHKERVEAEMRQMQESMRGEIRSVLRPDQLAKYDEWREERRREREKHEAERRAAGNR
ncbi:MAG: hypothetical protein KIT83_19095 [Bryobacterales bacterium]|nr:hypothetical protein [Bryobacterales bacterium]